MKDRRTALATLAGTLVATIAGRAHALRLEPMENYRATIEAACGAEAAFHREVLAAAETELGIELNEDQRQQALAALRCPRCGCQVLESALGAGPALTLE